MAKRPESAEFIQAFELAKRFPGVELGSSYRTPAIKVKGKFLARLRTEAEGWLAIKCDFIDREMLLQSAPQVFHVTDHYRNHPIILVDLAEVEKDAFLDLFERAWRMTASKKLIRDYEDRNRD